MILHHLPNAWLGDFQSHLHEYVFAVVARHRQDLDLIVGHRCRYVIRLLIRNEDDLRHARTVGRALGHRYRADIIRRHNRGSGRSLSGLCEGISVLEGLAAIDRT